VGAWLSETILTELIKNKELWCILLKI